MMKNAVKNLGRYGLWQQLVVDVKAVVHDSLSETDFDEAWNTMVEKYGIRDNSWIKESYNLKRRWVPAYWRGTFCAGMSSTQRSEQANRFFKVRVNLETGLRNFITQFEIAQQTRVEEEKQQNFLCKERPLSYDKTVLVEEIFSQRYTNDKFREVQKQVEGLKHTNVVVILRMGSYIVFRVDEKIIEPIWKQGRKSFEVTIDKDALVFKCNCQLFEFRGILCKHIIACIEFEDIKSIPDTYILDRWRKDLIREYEKIRVGYYDPEESSRAKRAMDASLRNEYITQLALQDDESYAIYERVSGELTKELEAYVGIERVNSAKAGTAASKVFCRRRIQPRECNMRHIARNVPPPADGRLKDPIDKRGSGRAPKPRQKNFRKRVGGDIPQSPLSQRSRVSSDIDLT